MARYSFLAALVLPCIGLFAGCSGGDGEPPVTIDPNNPPSFMDTADAAFEGKLGLLKASVNATPSHLETTDEAGQSLLHHAAAGCHFEVVEYLLSSGADPNATDNQGRDALAVAMAENAESKVLILLRDARN